MAKGCRFEFDSVKQNPSAPVEGRLTDESVAEFYRAIREHWIASDASVGIVDFSAVKEFALSGDLIHRLAEQEPCIPDPTSRPRVIVAPDTHVFGLSRMFQILGEPSRPLLSVVHTLDEALAVLGIQSPHLAPVE